MHGPQARVDLSAIVEMSPATVSGVTGELMRAGALREMFGRESDGAESGRSRGRPKVTIALVPQTAHVIAVKLSINEIQVALGDFTGAMARTETVPLDTRALSPADIVRVLGDAIERCHRTMAPGYGPCLGVGLAVQGLVRDSDIIAWSPALSVRDVDIVRPLAQRFGLPVYAANDANCIAVALRNKPEFQAIDNMAVLMLGTGVGMGLIVGGKVYDGRTGAAAEFGHTKYQMDGPFCHCGRRGCIESFVGDYALYRDARAMLDLPNTDALHPSEEQMQVLLLTNAVTNGAAWPVAFHSFLGVKEGLSEEDVQAIRERRLPKDARNAALSRLARTLIEKRGQIDDHDIAAFTEAGFDQALVLDVVLVVAASTMTNYTSSVTQPPLEEVFQAYEWKA